EIAALEQDLPGADAPGRLRHQAHHRERAHRLAATRLADEGHRLALAHLPPHAVDRADHAGRGVEVGAETANVEENLHQAGSLTHRPRRSRPGEANACATATAALLRAARCGTCRSR